MAIITDPDQMLQGVEVTVNKAALLFTMNLSGNLSEDGFTGQAFYSFLKEEYLNEVNDIHKYPFPMLAITDEQFEMGNNGSTFSDWKFADEASRKLLRTAGLREYNAAGEIAREYICPITLGNIDATSKTVGDKARYAFSSDAASTEFTYAGEVNELIQTFGNAANGNFDKRSDVLTLYIRQQGKTYDQSSTIDIGVSSLTYKVERFPLSESVDDKILYTDAQIQSDAPFTGMSITYHQAAQSQTIGSGSYNFGVTVNGNGGDDAQIYAFTQYKLREIIDIDDEADAPGQVGDLQDQLLRYDGNTLVAGFVNNADGGGSGVRITDFDSNITNSLRFTDNAEAPVSFPFVAAGSFLFNTNIVNDSVAKYWFFFEDANGNKIDTDDAIIINNNAGAPLSGLVSGQANVSWDFDFDNNNQGGRAPGTNAKFVFRVMGLTTAQFAEVRGTITRAVGQNVQITSALERNYRNAA